VGYPSDHVGVYIQPIVQGTSCHCEFDFYFDPRLDEGAHEAERIVREGAEGSSRAGGFFSRPYLAWKEIAYRGSPAAAAMQKKIKRIFDPKGILNPGKLCF